MAVIAPVEQVGIDAQVYRLQVYLNDYLSALWNGTLNIYGRIYENQQTDGVHPEVYVDSNEYKEVFVDDRADLVVGFRVKNREIKDNRRMYAKLDVIFTGNINTLLAVTERQDERVFLQAYQGLRKSMLVESISSPKTGVDDVFAGFKTDGMKYRDMHPYFCLSFEIEVQYSENIC